MSTAKPMRSCFTSLAMWTRSQKARLKTSAPTTAKQSDQTNSKPRSFHTDTPDHRSALTSTSAKTTMQNSAGHRLEDLGPIEEGRPPIMV